MNWKDMAMNRILSVLLIEDDPEERQDLVRCIDACPHLVMAAATADANEGLAFVLEMLPEIIILDLELHLGGGNCIVFLQELKDLSLNVSPYILITTNNNSPVTNEYVRQNGGDFIFSKHQADYSPQNVVDLLLTMTTTIINKFHGNMSAQKLFESEEQSRKSIIKRIQSELNLIGVNPKVVGYKYIVDAIELVIGGVQHNYCAMIGEKYNKSSASVERAMQNAINRTWRSGDIDVLAERYKAYLSPSRGVPTHTELVHYYANIIRTDFL